MYKIAADLSQRKARQLWLSDLLPANFDDLPIEQQRENLVAQLKRLETVKAATKEASVRRELGLQKRELEQEIHAIRPKLKGPKNVTDHFVQVARERLTPFQFLSFMNEASKRAAAIQRSEETQ